MRYWEYRIVQLENKLHLSALEKEKLISRVYQLASLGMTDEINLLLQSLSEKAAISELNSFLSTQSFREFKLSNADYLKQYRADLSDRTIKDMQRVASFKKIQKRVALSLVIKKHIDRALTIEGKTIQQHLEDIYIQTFDRIAEDNNFLLGIPREKANNDRAMAVITAKWADDNKNIAERIALRKAKLEKSIMQEVERSVILGRTADETKTAIAKKMSASKKASDTLLETESTRVLGEAQADSAEEHGTNKYINIATLDSKTTEICREMDKEVFNYSERIVGVNAPPYHYRCRTVTAMYFTDEIQERIRARLGNMRMSRDKKNISVYFDDVPYREWEKRVN